MKSLLVALTMSLSVVASAQGVPKEHRECLTKIDAWLAPLIKENPSMRSNLFLVLAEVATQESFEGINDAEWQTCRTWMKLKLSEKFDKAYKSSNEKAVRDMKRMLQERQRAYKATKSRCRARGGRWSLSQGMCSMPNSAQRRAQRKYEQQMREGEAEAAKRRQKYEQRRENARRMQEENRRKREQKRALRNK